MRRSNLVLWWCALLLVVVYATQNEENSALEDKQNDTVQYEFHVNFVTMQYYDAHFTRGDKEGVRQKYRNTYAVSLPGYTKSHYEKGNQDKSAELRSNTTKTNNEGCFTMSHDLRSQNNSDDGNLSNMYHSTICIPICCEIGYRMINSICTPDAGYHPFPEVNGTDKKMEELFQLIVLNPCPSNGFMLEPEVYVEDEYAILTNGSIYLPHDDRILNWTTYCFAVIKEKYRLIMCFDKQDDTYEDMFYISLIYDEYIRYASLLMSVPFLLLTFVVYTILPELKNVHGHAIRAYVGSLTVAFLGLVLVNLSEAQSLNSCIALAFIIYFSFIASFFWINVICFDIWWMFRKYRPLQRNVKQRGRKKLILYSIYAWGCSCMFCIFCAIMDFVPGVNTLVSNSFTRPGFGKIRCWFSSDEAKLLYFYGPAGITVICNIYMFILTTLKFVRHKATMDHYMRNSESTIHEKHWYKLLMKLFFVMVFHYSINWSVEVITWLNFKFISKYMWYIADLTNALHGLIIFITFVWNDRKLTACCFPWHNFMYLHHHDKGNISLRKYQHMQKNIHECHAPYSSDKVRCL